MQEEGRLKKGLALRVGLDQVDRNLGTHIKGIEQTIIVRQAIARLAKRHFPPHPAITLSAIGQCQNFFRKGKLLFGGLATLPVKDRERDKVTAGRYRATP